MKIQYIETDDIYGFGDILVLLKDGHPVAHHDHSDGYLELDDFSNLIKPFEINIEFESVDNPSKELIKEVKRYLIKEYGEPEEDEE